MRKEKNFGFSRTAILVLVVAFSLLLLGAISLFSKSHFKSSVQHEQSSFAALRSMYASLIRSYGPYEAYRRFKEMNQKTSQNLQHANAHIFGEVLYETVGLLGAKICDTSFAFGCYHSFFAKAISANGISILDRLDAECKTLPAENDSIGCSHGLGHGIAYYLGDKKLHNSLEMCDRLSFGSRIGSCVSGVIMEYNLHTMNNPETNPQSIRKIANTDPLEPCESLPLKFHQACYYEMPQWWNLSYGYGKSSQIIGDLCQKIADPNDQVICFRGAGNIAAPTSNYDPEKTESFCQNLNIRAGTKACLKSAILAFKSLPNTGNGISYLCTRLNDPSNSECR